MEMKRLNIVLVVDEKSILKMRTHFIVRANGKILIMGSDAICHRAQKTSMDGLGV